MIRLIMKKLFIRLIMIISLYFILCNIAIYLYSHIKPPSGADTMVILGAQVVGEPARPSKTLRERLDTAITYLNENPQTIVIVCGGKGGDELATEASIMKSYLVAHGIETERIYEEDQSTRTAQQFVYANRIKPLGKTVVVTNEFHMLRSIMLAKRSHITQIYGLAAKTHFSNKEKYRALWREPLALLNSFLFDRIDE